MIEDRLHALRCMEIRGGNGAVSEVLSTPGLDGWVGSRPHHGDVAGGDVHYVSACGGGVVTRLVVADVSGHGEVVDGFARALRGLVRKNINRKSQTRMVGALNAQFAAMARLERFATAVVGTYLATTSELSICNAGHPRPLWYRAALGRWEPLAAGEGNLPLGVDEGATFEQFAVTLGPGDLVLVYTDALVEAPGPDGRPLGEVGLLALASELEIGEPEAVGPALLDAVEAHRGGGPADDDVTLLVLRQNGRGRRRLGVGDKVEVYAKVFGLRGY